jgi:UDPglucose 6-dehydrogenase
MVDKLRAVAGGSVAGARIGVWGLTFKANTDDLRDSPALYVVRRLVEEGAEVRAYDPVAGDVTPFGVHGIERADDPYEAAAGASIVALLTEWDEFRWLDFGRVHDAMRPPRALVDARNILDPAAMRRRGFAYGGVGR